MRIGIRNDRRGVLVSVLIALAGILAVIGDNTSGTARQVWFGFALITGATGLGVNTLPASDLLPRSERRALRRYRDRLTPRDGWQPGVFSTVGGTALLVSHEDREVIPGFLCEVHAPDGIYWALTDEAARIARESRERGLASIVPLPAPSSTGVLLFPGDFRDALDHQPRPVHALTRGDYFALWFGWEREIDGAGLSVNLVFLAAVEFDFGLAGLTQS